MLPWLKITHFYLFSSFNKVGDHVAHAFVFSLRRLFSSRTSLDRIASCSSGEGSLLDLSSLGLTHVPQPERMATVRGEVDLSGNKVRTEK